MYIFFIIIRMRLIQTIRDWCSERLYHNKWNTFYPVYFYLIEQTYLILEYILWLSSISINLCAAAPQGIRILQTEARTVRATHDQFNQ